MDAIGSFCGENVVSFFGVNELTETEVYNEYLCSSDIDTTSNSYLTSIAWNNKQNQLICSTNSRLFSLKAQRLTSSRNINVNFNAKLNNIESICCNNKWIGFTNNNDMYCVDSTTGTLISNFRNNKYNFNVVSFLANRYLIGGDTFGNILIHNCNSHLLSCNFNNYTGISSVNCIRDNNKKINIFLACNNNGYVYMFDVTTEKILYYSHSGSAREKVATESTVLNECDFNPNYSNVFVACSMDKNLIFFDANATQSGREPIRRIKCESSLSCVKYLPNSDHLVLTCSVNGCLYIYDTRMYKLISKFQNSNSYNDNCILNLAMLDSSELRYSDLVLKHAHNRPTGLSQAPREGTYENKEDTDTRHFDSLENKHTPALSNNDGEDVESKIKKAEAADEPVFSQSIESVVSGLPQFMEEKFGKLNLSAEIIGKKIIGEKATIIDSDANAHPARGGPHTDSTEYSQLQNVDEQTGLTIDHKELSLDKIRSIVREEMMLSEKRILQSVGKMVSQLHSDLIDQFDTSETNVSRNIKDYLENNLVNAILAAEKIKSSQHNANLDTLF